MTTPLLLVLSQIADGLSFGLARGTELNPIAVTLFASGGFGLILAVKGLSAFVLGVGAYSRPERRSLWLWLSLAGFVGCLTNLLGAL
jgi:hypothetical protein